MQGRLGGFVPPRSPVEEAHTRLGGGDLTRIRAQVSLSALESLAVHLGGLREGRKSILYVSQGPPMLRGGVDLTGALRDVIVAANRNNVTIHTLDPRQLGEARMVSDANAALSADTGGRRIGLTNDFSRPLQGVMADASAYYLLGYESPATAADGKFRKIDVGVRRGGVRVIARTGYWAPRPEDLRTVGRGVGRADRSRLKSPRRSTRSGTSHGGSRSPTGLASGRSTRDKARSRWSSRRLTARAGAAHRRWSNSRSRGPTASSRTPRRSRSRPACGRRGSRRRLAGSASARP